MNYQQCVRFLYSLGNEIPTAKFDLTRIRLLLERLGSPHQSGRFIHLAGTNGKGSTAAMIESGLRYAGLRTGLYTSPHLVEPTERIRIEGRPVSQDQFAAAFQQVHQTAESMLRAAELDLHPTYFETVTAMAFVLFEQARLDRVVLETGLGGRLDATNVVAPELCIITPIDLDHQFFLGETIGKIAAEKAGILKPGVPALFGHQHPEAAQVLREHARGPFAFTHQWPISHLEIDARSSRFQVRGGQVVCPLAGHHQVENARTAAVALRELGFAPDGIAHTEWPGRLERVSDSPEIILDGAHNPAGVRALAQHIRHFYKGRTISLVFGVMRDKSVAEMTAMLFPLARRIILTAPANSRAMPPEAIPAPAGAVITRSVREAVDLVRNQTAGEVTFIAGSLFVVGEARALLVK